MAQCKNDAVDLIFKIPFVISIYLHIYLFIHVLVPKGVQQQLRQLPARNIVALKCKRQKTKWWVPWS